MGYTGKAVPWLHYDHDRSTSSTSIHNSITCSESGILGLNSLKGSRCKLYTNLLMPSYLWQKLFLSVETPSALAVFAPWPFDQEQHLWFPLRASTRDPVSSLLSSNPPRQNHGCGSLQNWPISLTIWLCTARKDSRCWERSPTSSSYPISLQHRNSAGFLRRDAVSILRNSSSRRPLSCCILFTCSQLRIPHDQLCRHNSSPWVACAGAVTWTYRRKCCRSIPTFSRQLSAPVLAIDLKMFYLFSFIALLV